MKATTIFLVFGYAMILAACGTAAANVASSDKGAQVPVTSIAQPAGQAGMEVSPQTVGVAKENANAEPASSIKKNESACPVTKAPEPLFVPPAPYPSVAPYGNFWYGNENLWTMVSPGGSWGGLPNDGAGFGQKVFWWRNGYTAQVEPAPPLQVTGRQLDGDGTFTGMDATNAQHKDFGGWAMLTGVNFPTQGCWEITGEYGGETLSFVIEVGN